MKLVNARLVLAVCALITGFSLSAQASYTAANVKGSYSFLLNQWTATAGNNSGMLGILSFDGASSVTGGFAEVTSTGLQTIAIETGSTYTVASNGAGSATLVTAGGDITIDFVLSAVSGGVAQGLQLLAVNSGGGNYVAAGSAIAMNLTGSASAASLKGSYSFLTNDWSADTSVSQTGSLGTAKFDGVSAVSLSYTQESGGVTKTLTLKGTYSVNADGSGTMVFTRKKGTLTVYFVLNSFVKSVARSVQYLTSDSSADAVSTGTGVFQ